MLLIFTIPLFQRNHEVLFWPHLQWRMKIVKLMLTPTLLYFIVILKHLLPKGETLTSNNKCYYYECNPGQYILIIINSFKHWITIKTFNSIFNSKTKSNYSFKEFIHSKTKSNYSFKEFIHSKTKSNYSFKELFIQNGQNNPAWENS